MKFFSNTARLSLVLRNGVQGNPNEHRPHVPTLMVKFEDGQLTVNDNNKEVIDLLLAHSGLGKTFTADSDRFKVNRDQGPVHQIMEMTHGSVSSVIGGKPKVDVQAQIMSAAKDIAAEMVKAMIPGITEAVKAELATKQSVGKVITDQDGDITVVKTGDATLSDPVGDPAVGDGGKAKVETKKK